MCVVFGSSTAGGAYQPGMSDYTVMVKEKVRWWEREGGGELKWRNDDGNVKCNNNNIILI